MAYHPLERQKKFSVPEREVGDRGVVSEMALARGPFTHRSLQRTGARSGGPGGSQRNSASKGSIYPQMELKGTVSDAKT